MAMAAPGSAQLLLVLMVVAIISAAESQTTCSDVETEIDPCLSYLTATGPLTSSCCSAVNNIYAQVMSSSNSAMLTDTCQCLKTLADSTSDLNLDNCENLPQQCGVSLPFTISPNTNCDNL